MLLANATVAVALCSPQRLEIIGTLGTSALSVTCFVVILKHLVGRSHPVPLLADGRDATFRFRAAHRVVAQAVVVALVLGGGRCPRSDTTFLVALSRVNLSANKATDVRAGLLRAHGSRTERGHHKRLG